MCVDTKDMIDLKSLTINSMMDYLKDLSLPKYKIENIYKNIHKNRIENIDEITTLKKEERANLKKISYLSSIKEVAQFRSKIDNTKKYIFEFNDGELIETVFMKHLDRNTICISSQVGCRMGCIFCASTKGGLARNLTSGEMLNQIYYVEKDNNVNVNNIVLMGQGEPLDNFDNVVDFLNIITSENGANKSMRKITLSTCGLVDKIYKLADLNYPLTLAISLHRTNDCARNELMPINKRYNIKSLIESAAYYFNKTGRRVSFEYMVIENENDSSEDIEALIEIIAKTNAHLNVLELNPIEEYNKDSKKGIGKIFIDRLKKHNINATYRKSMGKDIEGACGQLRRKFKNN